VTAGGVTLRPYTQEDHDRAHAWLQSPELRRLIGTTVQPTPESHRAWLDEMRRRADRRLMSICLDGAHVGNLYLVDINQRLATAQVQLFIGATDVRGCGVGTEAIRAARSLAFGELELHGPRALVFPINERTVRCLEIAGFLLEGRLREHRIGDDGRFDVLILGSLRTDG